jgi:RNA methyltransferase, TrmH family
VPCAPGPGGRARGIYAAPELFLGPLDAGLVRQAEARGARVLELGREAFESVSGQTRPDGIAAVVERWPTTLRDLRPSQRHLLVVVDAVERPGNLGTIIRSACCAGATGVVVSDARFDLLHPESVRGSVGTIFSVPLARATAAEAVRWLRERLIDVAVATPAGERAFRELDLTRPVGIVVGSERHGVGLTWRAAANATVAIPMPGPADSLNVAVAAGVVLFEAARQRLCVSAPRVAPFRRR